MLASTNPYFTASLSMRSDVLSGKRATPSH